MGELTGLVGELEQTLKPIGAAPTFKEATRQFAIVQDLHAVVGRAAQAELRAVGDAAVNALLAVLSTESCAPVRHPLPHCGGLPQPTALITAEC